MNRTDQPGIRVKAPGRINLIGEHTDYNDGLILSAAIDKYLTIVAEPNAGGIVNIRSLDYDESLSIDPQNIPEVLSGSWSDYLSGVIREMQVNGFRIRGFDCTMRSDIPIGSGLSSSAALCCGFIKTLDALFGFGLSNWEIIDLARGAENNQLGINSGFLDHFSSVFGKTDTALFMNCGTKAHIEIPCHLDGYKFVLINTRVKHDHSTSGYNDRFNECMEALQVLNTHYRELSALSDLNRDDLPAVKNLLKPLHFNRARYIVEENLRVHEVKTALQSNNLERLGQLLYAGHDGLKNLYEVSCEELDFLVDQTHDSPDILGARMMGGGFGGCTLNLIRNEASDAIDRITHAYPREFGINPEVYDVRIGAGLHVMSQ